MRDRDLVRLYWPVALRPAFDALFDVDDAMGAIVARSTEPALAAIKLAWWRDALERLDSAAAPAEPRLQAAATELLPRGLSGEDLAAIAPGWTTLLDAEPELALIERRGEILFRLGARVLGGDDPMLDAAGRTFAVVDVARRCGDDNWRTASAGMIAHRFARRLRPLTALASLALRDLQRGPDEPEGTPGRAMTLIAHRLTGRLG